METVALDISGDSAPMAMVALDISGDSVPMDLVALDISQSEVAPDLQTGCTFASLKVPLQFLTD